MKRSLISGLCLIMLAGCAMRSGNPEQVQPSRTLPFTKPIPTETPWLAMQHISMVHKSKAWRFDATVEVELDRWAMVALTPLGTRGFALVWDSGLSYDHLPFFNPPLKPGDMFAAWQLIHQPIDKLRKQLESPWRLEENTDRSERTLLKGKKVFAVVRYSDNDPKKGHASLHHRKAGYLLEITTKSVELLDDTDDW